MLLSLPSITASIMNDQRKELFTDDVQCLFQDCIISDCGEIAAGEDDGFLQDDGTGDVLPDSPNDSGLDFKDVCAYLCPFQNSYFIFLH